MKQQLMRGQISVRLIADAREDLVEAIVRMAGLGVDLNVPDRPGRKGEWLAYGTVELHNMPENADARVARMVRSMFSVAHHGPHGVHTSGGTFEPAPESSGGSQEQSDNYTVREILEAQLARLQEMPPPAERVRADTIAVAIEHLQQAIASVITSTE
jgi:hypothetical protein